MLNFVRQASSMRPEKYSILTRWLHWIVAVLFILMLTTGSLMEDSSSSSDKLIFLRLHATFGISIGFLLIVRLIMYFRDNRPEHRFSDNPRLRKVYDTTHVALLLSMFYMALSGLYSLFNEEFYPAIADNDPGLMPNLEEVGHGWVMESHHAMATVCILLLIIHLSGAILYWIRQKEHPFKRIV